MIIIYKRNTAWSRDTVRKKVPMGSQRQQGGPQVLPRPLISRETSAWSHRVTTQYSFIQYKFVANTTIVMLWNYKWNDLPTNGSPTREWRRQPNPQFDKVSEGRRPEHLLNNPGTVLNLKLRPSIYIYILGYFAEICNRSHRILQRIYRLTDCNRRPFALSRRCRMFYSRPRVLRETQTAILFWR